MPTLRQVHRCAAVEPAWHGPGGAVSGGLRAHCEQALGHQVPVGDVMRCLMYHHSYGDHLLAREVFGQLPLAVRGRLAGLDYSTAERVCPHGLPIARLMRQAHDLLA